jgi:hypothetical protein
VSRPAVRAGLIDRGVYGTIVVTSVLVVYDGWSRLKLGDAILVILGPIVAMVIGHIFAASLAAVPELGRRPTGREFLLIVRQESPFLLVCAPQIVVLLLLTLARLGLSHTIRVLIWAGPVALGFWGGLAARRAGMRGRGLTLATLTGLAVGGVVLLLQLVLQPGKVVSNGVALIQPATTRDSACGSVVGGRTHTVCPRSWSEPGAAIPGPPSVSGTIRRTSWRTAVQPALLAGGYACLCESSPPDGRPVLQSVRVSSVRARETREVDFSMVA